MKKTAGKRGHRQQIHAVVLSGSGADGAYQVGVLKALCQGLSPATRNLPIDPRVFAATSTGAFNACVLLSHWDDDIAPALRRLESEWCDRLSWNRFVNGSFRVRLNPLELLDSRAYTTGPGFVLRRLWGDFLDLSRAAWPRALPTSLKAIFERLADQLDLSILVGIEPFEETIAEAIDFQKVCEDRKPRRRLTIAASDWKTGKVRHFVNRPGLFVVGPEVVRAASAVPGIHGPEAIDGKKYADGEAQVIAPLSSALDQLDLILAEEPGDYDFHLHVVYMSAKENEMPASALESILRTLYGSQVIDWTSRIEQDLDRARGINEGLSMLEDLAALDEYEEGGSQEGETEAIRKMRERVAALPGREKKGLQTAARIILRRRAEKEEWKKLTIHRYFPTQGLDNMFGFLDFRRSRIENLIEQGYLDTVGHDCRANGCIPPRPEPETKPELRDSGRRKAAKARRKVLPYPRHALILSGGGAYGAYQVGVAQALFHGKSPSTEKQPLRPEVFAGTSIGAFNASFLVSKGHEGGERAVAGLREAWLEQMSWKSGTNGAFRVRLNPLDIFSPGEQDPGGAQPSPFRYLSADFRHLLGELETRGLNLFRPGDPFLDRLTSCFDLSIFVAAEPWEKTIRDLIDIRRIRDSPQRLTIAATSWTHGTVRHFDNDDVKHEAIRASSAVPGFYPPAIVDGETCVDGAVLMNTPLKPAIGKLAAIASKAGESDFVLHVVYMSGDVEKSSVAQGTLQTLFRSQAIRWGTTVEQDIEQARTLNQGLAFFIETLVGLGKKPGKDLTAEEVAALHEVVRARSRSEGRALLETSERILRRREAGRPYKQLTIHRYFPRRDLGGVLGFLDLRRSRLEDLIRQGFEDAVRHDCDANQCVRVKVRPP